VINDITVIYLNIQLCYYPVYFSNQTSKWRWMVVYSKSIYIIHVIQCVICVCIYRPAESMLDDVQSGSWDLSDPTCKTSCNCV